ncbi:MAG: tetratricopeptide repeat protein [Planctomycetaceae bacterium]|nr:tetratricopeptide repeat protein [Planctomycetaceae bacterium]
MSASATTSDQRLASSPALAGERVAFTGTLASMTHAQAAELVEKHGGTSSEHVSRQTTMLVIGEEGWPLDDDGHISVKLQQAQRWHDGGVELRLVNESDWLLLLGLTERREEIRRLHTPAMLSQLLDVSVHVIRGWARAGLIRPVKRVYRLPYFDFQEVTSARRLSQLMAAGVSRREIEEALSQLPAVQRGDQRPLEQLEILARNAHVVVRDAHGLLAPGTGQRLFDFEPEQTAAEPEQPAVEAPTSIRLLPQAGELPDRRDDCDWFVEGCRRYSDGEFAEAAVMLRLGLMTDPHNAEAHFHLAECLYRQDNVAGALERYYVAVEHDREYIEAWTQIGCLHRELGQLESALDAFDVALAAHPEYPDAHFQKAETLAELGHAAEAVPYWRRYLSYDNRGPWAELARQRLSENR